MPCLRQRRGAAIRAPRHPHQQRRHPQIREGRRGERGELERDPRRQPDELRLYHGFTSSDENAVELLVEYGLVERTPTGGKWTKAGSTLPRPAVACIPSWHGFPLSRLQG